MGITVLTLGPDAAGQLTLEAADLLRNAGRVLLRTGKHGAAAWLTGQGIPFDTLDALYDVAEDFDALAGRAADAVLAAARDVPSLCYGVADPLTDATIAALAARGIDFDTVAGVTLDAGARIAALGAGIASPSGIRILPATSVVQQANDPSLPLLITELNSRLLAGDVKLKLLDIYPPELTILLDQGMTTLDALDRQDGYSHLSYAYIPACPMERRTRYTFDDLLAVMTRLRDPAGGCPWDKEQTHETLRPYVIEEAYELVDAIDRGDMGQVADELGDVLLQTVFHAQVARDHGTFDITDVTTAICHKMITRHVHIFGDVKLATSDDVLQSWDAIKRKEKGQRTSSDAMRDIPGHLPALMQAAKVQSKARQVGFDWTDPKDALQKVSEELSEVTQDMAAGADPAGELGDLLFATVNVARLLGIEPELALRAATDKFIRRFSLMESAVRADGKALRDMTLPEMDVYWDAVKAQERKAP